MRYYLLATCAIAALATPAAAETVSGAVTTTIRTSTIKSGSPDFIAIAKGASVKIEDGVAVWQDSNHDVTNEGTIAIKDGDPGSTGIAAAAGTNGKIDNKGTITIDESYTPEDTDKDGDLDGPLAVGSNRYGIRTQGAHQGAISNSGTITVEGKDSGGIWLGGTQTGDVSNTGTIGIVGDRSEAIHAQDVVGNVSLGGTISAQGEAAVAVHLAGNVTGAVNVTGKLSSTGYRYTTPPSDTSKLDADDLLQGGSALLIEGDVTGGVMIAGASGEGDSAKPAASIISYGAAPAVMIGGTTGTLSIGKIASNADEFGLVVNGTVEGRAVYSDVAATGMQIGGRGGAVNVAGGMSVGGGIGATSSNAAATALHIGSGASVPTIRVSGTLTAKSGNTDGSIATALLVDTGSSTTTIKNSGTISAETGTKGTAYGISDKSGNVTLVENSGAISAKGAGDARSVAIDLSANTSGATVKQTAVAEGKTAPSITGDVRFGSGNDVFDVADGTVTGSAYFGTGDNVLNLSGKAKMAGNLVFGAGADTVSLTGSSQYSGTADFGGGSDVLNIGGTAIFAGKLVNASGLAVNVTGGTFSVSSPSTIGSLNVAEGGTLGVVLDKAAGTNPLLSVTGDAKFGKNATLAFRLADVSNAEGRYLVVQAGNLAREGELKTNTDLIPFLFKANIVTDGPANQLSVDVKRRTASELGFNRSQTTAYNPIFAALGKDADIGAVFLGITDGDKFRDTVNQMLPDHAGGAFQGISMGTRAFIRQLADPMNPTYQLGGLDITVSAAGWDIDKDQGQTAAFDAGGFGFSAAAQKDIGFGSVGLSASYLWNDYTSGGDDNRVISNTYELAAFWQGQWGGIAAFSRASVGKADFDGRRNFHGVAGDKNIDREVSRNWDGTLVTFAGGISGEGGGRYFFFRPAVSFDYIRLKEDGYTETGGGKALDLIIDDRTSDELGVNASMTVGVDLKGTTKQATSWFRLETEGGWREIVSGSLGSTTARFAEGEAFTLDPEQVDSGWFARLSALAGAGSYTFTGSVGAEDRLDDVALTLRGSLRLRF
ncbi:autotransporter domain-containing protein [Altererythrobacter indicus]|uniref:Autotransporter domain-containing protein n=1 Tax=Altericroceibacterium indicum TaxID=374177 RepID=A0A845AA46_9SPHN|nr:autotransporter outer membrane beta-barrel domain-containing protein [Altericroceibacterium indicum]MXP27120.1 autotransporter domain-containing protein [Altericroceibacterium indicum]